MKNFVVTAAIEVEAASKGEAEDVVVDMALEGQVPYIEIKEVKEIG